MSGSPTAAPIEDDAVAPPPPLDVSESRENTHEETPVNGEPSKAEELSKDEEKVDDQTSPDLDALVAELRASLASSQTLLSTQATRLSTLTDVETELAQLKDQYAFLAAAKDAVEKQLQEETKRREMAEENVEMLRGQVEQARRGVGILQKQEKERKRLSLIPGLHKDVDMEETLAETPKEGVTSRANKRTSILLGRNQKMSPSENSEATLPNAPNIPSNTSPNANTNRGGLRELRLGSGNAQVTTVNNAAATSPSATPSSFIDDSAMLPTHPPLPHQISSTSVTSQGSEISPSKTEESQLRAELAATQTKLTLAEEARDASEACLKALREFMAAGGTEGEAADGDLLKSIRLPPLPTDSNLEERDLLQPEQPKKTWGFKLWKQGPASPASTIVEPPATPHDNFSPPASVRGGTTPRKDSTPLPTPGDGPTEGMITSLPGASTPLSNLVSNWTRGVAPGTPADGISGKPNAARTLSSFFSRKKDDAGKEKDLPTPPEDPADENAMRKDLPEEGLQPSPQIADKAIGDEEEYAGQVGGQAAEVQGKDNDREVKDTPYEISLNDPLEETAAVPEVEAKDVAEDREEVKEEDKEENKEENKEMDTKEDEAKNNT